MRSCLLEWGCGTLAMALAYAQLLLEVSSNDPETTQKRAKLQILTAFCFSSNDE